MYPYIKKHIVQLNLTCNFTQKIILISTANTSSLRSMNLPAIITAKYDMLIFSQAWPMTNCYEWEEISPSHQCNLPPDEEWSIHGLWPTRNGTMGPFFCNKTMHFDLAALDSLRAQLEVKWIDVHKGAKPHEFWRHEWEKHGTCSVDLEAVSSEKKYFKKGLDLLDQYDMKHVLGKASIVPNGKYHLQDYLDGVRKILGKNAQVECVRNTVRSFILTYFY